MDGLLGFVKSYMRLDTDDDDLLVGVLVAAAVEYMREAGVATPSSDGLRYSLYMLAVASLSLTMYERRDTVITGTIVAENPMTKRVIAQLKLTEPRG